jgi:hypothetical protein
MKRCTKCGKRKPLRAFPWVGKEYPGKRQSHCTACQVARARRRARMSKQWIREYAAGWYRKNQGLIDSAKDFVSRRGRRGFGLTTYYRMRHEAILAYGGYRCACCGITEPLFLTLDHVNEGGLRQRREVGASTAFFHWLKDNCYPPGFQVLCTNCNHGRYRNGGLCPHKDPVRKKRR